MILTNTEVIAVDQDTLGVQGTKVADNGNGLQVWTKKLQGGSVAVVLLNRSGSAANITANWSNIGVSGSASVRDLWAHADLGSFSNSYTTNVPSHGVVMLKIGNSGSVATPTPTPGTTPTPTRGTTPTPSSSSSCKVTYTVVNQWAGGFQTALAISNTGSTNLNGWSLTFSFANGQQISQSWNATYVQSGNQVTLTNALL